MLLISSFKSVFCFSQQPQTAVEDVPQFTKCPKDSEIFIGDSVTFDAEISSHSPCKVEWLRGEEVLSSGKNIEISESKNTFKLVLTNATIDDEGFYKCIARNEAGKMEYEFELLVEGISYLYT